MNRSVAIIVAVLACLPLAARDATHARQPQPSPGSTAPSDPRFDWFAYEGGDPVYDAVPERAGEYRNPILAGFYPDPSIVRVGVHAYHPRPGQAAEVGNEPVDLVGLPRES